GRPVDGGHERGALLVAGRDVADTGRGGEGFEKIHGLLARYREDELAALGDEAIDQQAGGGLRAWLWIGHGGECSEAGGEAGRCYAPAMTPPRGPRPSAHPRTVAAVALAVAASAIALELVYAVAPFVAGTFAGIP